MNKAKVISIEMVSHSKFGSSNQKDWSGNDYVAIAHWSDGAETSIMAKDLEKYKSLIQSK